MTWFECYLVIWISLCVMMAVLSFGFVTYKIYNWLFGKGNDNV